MEAGRMEWRLDEVDPSPVLGDALAATSGLFKERGVALEVALPEHLPAVHVDRDRLVQVAINLLSNAVKFCAIDDGRVWFEASVRRGMLWVTVRDNGRGLSESEREVVFERFRQVGDTLTDKPKGTGLGLPICRQIIEYFGGRIWIEAARGGGALVTFTVPCVGMARDGDEGNRDRDRRAAE